MKAVVAETENPQPKYFIVLVIRWKLMVIHNDVLSIDIVCEDFWTSSMTLYLQREIKLWPEFKPDGQAGMIAAILEICLNLNAHAEVLSERPCADDGSGKGDVNASQLDPATPSPTSVASHVRVLDLHMDGMDVRMFGGSGIDSVFLFL